MNAFFGLILFIIAVLWFMYLPAEGLFLLGNVKYTGWRRLILGLVTGTSFFIFLTYILASIHVRSANQFLLSIIDIWVLTRRKRMSYLFTGWKGPHVLLTVFALTFSLSVITSGWLVPQGLAMRSVNGQDGIWNIALAQELKESFPPQHPSIAGIPLKGYHIFYNLWIAEIGRIVPIPLADIHYHYASILLAFLFVYSIYMLSEKIGHTAGNALWGTFFAVFGGSFAFILPVIYHRVLSLDDGFGITQPYSLLLSPSVTLSVVVLCILYILICEYIRKESLMLCIVAALLAGISVGIKVYAGVIAVGVLGCISVYFILIRKQIRFVLPLLLCVVISTVSFFPLNASYGFLIFEFLWPPHRLMEGTLNFTNWELKRQTLRAMDARLGLLKLEIQAMAYFLIGNIGTRIIGIFGLFPLKKRIDSLGWMLLLTLGISFIMPMIFIQPIGAYNMIQFFWYFMVFAGIIFGIGIARLLSRLSGLQYLTASIFIILFTLPSAVSRLYFLAHGLYFPVSRAQMQIYSGLSKMGAYSDVVLELPNTTTYSTKELEKWGQYISLPFIPAFAQKRVFFGGEVVQFRYQELWQSRLPVIESFMSPQGTDDPIARKDAFAAAELMSRVYHVRYIVATDQNLWFSHDPHFKQVLHNEFGTVYEIRLQKSENTI